MEHLRRTDNGQQACLARLSALAPLSASEILDLLEAVARAGKFRARREIINEGDPVGRPRIIVRGWAARIRHFKDGRRQILHLLIASDLIDHCSWDDAVPPTTVGAVTDVHIALAPSAEHAASGLGGPMRSAWRWNKAAYSAKRRALAG